MTRAELEHIARDLGELRIEVDRVLGRVLAALHADRIEGERLERARDERELRSEPPPDRRSR